MKIGRWIAGVGIAVAAIGTIVIFFDPLGGKESISQNFVISIVGRFAEADHARQVAGTSARPYSTIEIEELRKKLSDTYGVSKIVVENGQWAVFGKSYDIALLFDSFADSNGILRFHCSAFPTSQATVSCTKLGL